MTFRGLSFSEEERAFLQQRVALFWKVVFLIDPELDSLILDCLAKDPTRRPAGAHEMRRRLECCEAFGAWTGEEAYSWWQANREALSTTPQADEDSNLTLTRRQSDPRSET